MHKNILDATFELGWAFRQHTQNINVRVKSRLNAMKALSSTSFGHSKEFLLAFCRQFVRSILSYASPAWHPNLAQSHMKVLQSTQKYIIRIAIVCSRSNPTVHLYEERVLARSLRHADIFCCSCHRATLTRRAS